MPALDRGKEEKQRGVSDSCYYTLCLSRTPFDLPHDNHAYADAESNC